LATRAEQPPAPAWQRGKVAGWLVTVDHKRIGILYIATAGVFFAISGFLALLIRTQLAQPDGHVITGNSYNEVVTMHGTGMVFFVVVPILAGLANFLVPLMIGAPDMAFPRLNALSYWLYAFAGLIFCFRSSPQAGPRTPAGRRTRRCHSRRRATARTSGSSRSTSSRSRPRPARSTSS